jgi:nucleoside-diphosphate-sugar epimerase
LNLIHVDDAAEVVVAVERCVTPPATLVVSDGQPVRRGDFYRELARLLSAPPPMFRAVEPGDDDRRAGGNKRVDSRRLWSILPAAPVFPSFREGLAAIVASAAPKAAD